jgi:hypothetical protein
VIEHALPGAAEQMEQDTGTFFDTDIPALLAWTFGAEDVVLAGADTPWPSPTRPKSRQP